MLSVKVKMHCLACYDFDTHLTWFPVLAGSAEVLFKWRSTLSGITRVSRYQN